MEAAGIICEYNPFHTAHLYHIEETRRRMGEQTAVICCMSGRFVQRGEPALFPPEARAEAALRCGADLVVELPLPWAMAPAERFARGGVALLQACRCSRLSFGCETDSEEVLQRAAEALEEPETDELVRKYLQKGLSYAAARESALRCRTGSEADVITTPNNILAVEYLRAIRSLQAGLKPMAIRRQGPAHDSPETGSGCASATAIRRLILSGQPWHDYIPAAAADVFDRTLAEGTAPVTPGGLERLILYRLRTMREEEYEALPENSEGLSRRLMYYGRTESTLEEVLQKTKSKRYTMARIKRMVMAALLGMTQADTEGLPPYIRVLGFNDVGRQYLRQLRTDAGLPVLMRAGAVKKLDARAGRLFALEAGAADICALAARGPAQPGGQLWRQNAALLDGGLTIPPAGIK